MEKLIKKINRLYNSIDKNLLDKFKSMVNKNTLYLFTSLVLIFCIGTFEIIVPMLKQNSDKNTSVANLQIRIAELEKRNNLILAKMKEDVTKKHTEELKVPRLIYSSPYPDLNIEDSSMELLDLVVNIIQSTGNTISEISFAGKPQEENIPDFPNVVGLDISLSCTYLSLENFLQGIYDMKVLCRN